MTSRLNADMSIHGSQNGDFLQKSVQQSLTLSKDHSKTDNNEEGKAIATG